jgi:hypothetical protein
LVATCGDASTTVTYVQAWEYWASGRPDNGCLVLWGMSLRWWGRIGQIVAFTGSLLLVAELVDLAGIAESFRAARPTFYRLAGAVWQFSFSWKVIVFLGSALLALVNLVMYLMYGRVMFGDHHYGNAH